MPPLLLAMAGWSTCQLCKNYRLKPTQRAARRTPGENHVPTPAADPVMLLAGCISLSSTESPSAPDYAGFCREKEMQCKEICGGVGVQLFSCKARRAKA